MGEENKKNSSASWGLSLSLRPPNTHIHQKRMCKREPHFFPTDEESSEMQKMSTYNNNRVIRMVPIRMVPKIMGAEVKSAPLVIDLEEVDQLAKVSSPNSTLSTTSAKRLGPSVDANSDDDNAVRDDQRKKLRLSNQQIMVLEQAFREHTTLNTKQKLVLAKQVNLRPRQVEVWFQNRRARTKLKQTEVDCEYLKRFCETLSEENRKLHKQVQDLRALKISSDHHSPTSLSICASCKSISTPIPAAKTPTGEVGRYNSGIFHRPVPMSLKKLSLSIASTSSSSKIFESHLPRV